MGRARSHRAGTVGQMQKPGLPPGDRDQNLSSLCLCARALFKRGGHIGRLQHYRRHPAGH
nr:MAG TPA: hypothetical protein [Caudoviricetes sp.]